MKIISDFHDYYDVGMQNGIDPQLPYRRFRREERIKNLIGFDGLWYLYEDDAFADKNRILYFGFAGKIYPALEHIDDSNETIYIFDPNRIDPLYFDDAIRQMMLCGRDEGRKRAENRCFLQIEKQIKDMFSWKDDKGLLRLFDELKTAIFVWWMESPTVIINERLNQYGFQKVLPPMQAFQELEMYVGACLTKPTIEEPPIPDKIKAEIHGFDKYSFRKDKNKKK